MKLILRENGNIWNLVPSDTLYVFDEYNGVSNLLNDNFTNSSFLGMIGTVSKISNSNTSYNFMSQFVLAYCPRSDAYVGVIYAKNYTLVAFNANVNEEYVTDVVNLLNTYNYNNITVLRNTKSSASYEYDLEPLISFPTLENLILNGTKLASASYNSQTYTQFPATIPLVSTADTLTVNGQVQSYIATLTNANNMKQVQVGQTVYSTFPATIPISSNTTIACSGEDDKVITIDYTNTGTPVITNT